MNVYVHSCIYECMIIFISVYVYVSVHILYILCFFVNSVNVIFRYFAV